MTDQEMLENLLDKMSAGSNIVEHAKREMPETSDEMDNMMRKCVIQMAQLFSTQGHSGFSASYASNILDKILRLEPIRPLTGESDEWCWLEYGPDMVAQNKRCSHVFMRSDGSAYDIEGRVFVEPDGCCYTSKDSVVEVVFPYVPTKEYVGVGYE